MTSERTRCKTLSEKKSKIEFQQLTQQPCAIHLIAQARAAYFFFLTEKKKSSNVKKERR